jgi:hypothetical protein
MSHGHARLGESTPRSVFYDQGRFGRLFPTLPVFAENTKPLRDALAELGAKNGPMDAADDLSDPITNNPDNPAITAGFTFLGQFVDHDMTFDPTSSLARQQDPESIRNFRIPALDLDSVYGSGPGGSPHLYDSAIDGGRTTSSWRRYRVRGPCPSTARLGWTSPATVRTPRSSAIPATTRTSSSPSFTVPCSASTTG